MQPARRTLDAALHEVFTDEPSTVTRAAGSSAEKRKMKIAIAYSKARKETSMSKGKKSKKGTKSGKKGPKSLTKGY